MKVILSWYEIFMGAEVGLARMIASMKMSGTNKVNNKDFGWHSDIEGALAEVAVAKHLNIFWDGSVNTFKRPDVGSLQIRHTQHKNGCLIVRRGDSDDEIYVLVTGTHPEDELRGFMHGFEAKVDEFWRNVDGKVTSPAWFVPQSRLTKMELLGWGR